MISASFSGRTAGARAATRSGGMLNAPGRCASSNIMGDWDSTRKNRSLRSILFFSSSRVTSKSMEDVPPQPRTLPMRLHDFGIHDTGKDREGCRGEERVQLQSPEEGTPTLPLLATVYVPGTPPTTDRT